MQAWWPEGAYKRGLLDQGRHVHRLGMGSSGRMGASSSRGQSHPGWVYLILLLPRALFKFTCTWTTFFPEVLPTSILTAPLSIRCRAEERRCPPSTLWRETSSSLKKEKVTSLENVDSPTLAEKLPVHWSPQWQGCGRWQEPPILSYHLSPSVALQTLKCTKA